MQLDQQGNEVHDLSGQNLEGAIAFRHREERYIRWPASAMHWLLSAPRSLMPSFQRRLYSRETRLVHSQLCIWVTSDALFLLIIFFPFALTAGILDWRPSAIFVLGLLALVGLDAATTSATEQLCANFRGTSSLSRICIMLVQNITPTTVSRRSVSSDNRRVYKVC